LDGAESRKKVLFLDLLAFTTARAEDKDKLTDKNNSSNLLKLLCSLLRKRVKGLKSLAGGRHFPVPHNCS